MDELFDDLCTRRTDESGTWQEYAGECLNHPIRELLHQDPFTYRAFAKPRGYAGDAVMMDYIYGLGETREAAQHATPLGRAIFSYMSSRPSAKGVRYRRELIAKIIDRVASTWRARVFAIAAGHLREAELSVAVQQGQLAEFVAIDQDPASLAVVARDYARFGVQTRGRLGPPDSRRQGESRPVRLRLRGRAVRLSQRAGCRRARAPHVRDDEARRRDAHPELPRHGARSRLHGIVHGLAVDLPRSRRHAGAGRRAP